MKKLKITTSNENILLTVKWLYGINTLTKFTFLMLALGTSFITMLDIFFIELPDKLPLTIFLVVMKVGAFIFVYINLCYWFNRTKIEISSQKISIFSWPFPFKKRVNLNINEIVALSLRKDIAISLDTAYNCTDESDLGQTLELRTKDKSYDVFASSDQELITELKRVIEKNITTGVFTPGKTPGK